MARGSLQEFETLCILAHRLTYARAEQLQELLERTDRISRMLTGLRKVVERDQRKPTNVEPVAADKPIAKRRVKRLASPPVKRAR